MVLLKNDVIVTNKESILVVEANKVKYELHIPFIVLIFNAGKRCLRKYLECQTNEGL